MREKIRFAVPSKGRMADQTFDFLKACGVKLYRPNDRQYIASIPDYPNVEVILQRPSDIVTGVREGSLDLGIAGYDTIIEKTFKTPTKVIVLHDELGYGKCTVNLAAPDKLEQLQTVDDLIQFSQTISEKTGKPLRIATKFPNVTGAFLEQHGITEYRLIDAAGTLEIAPTIGYADIIVDLVSSGMTLRDNHLHTIEGGELICSQASLVGNRHALKNNLEARQFAKMLIENIEAYQRGQNTYMVVTNVRGNSAEEVAQKLFTATTISGLRGPTIAPIYGRDPSEQNWFSVSIAISKNKLQTAIAELRSIGGSGVIVTPATYIFEEIPARYKAMMDELGKG